MVRKLTTKEVEEDLLKHNFILLDEYKNSSTKFKFKDKEGYNYYISYNTLKNNKYNVRKFDKSNPFTLENIKIWIKENKPDYELLSDKYKNACKDKLIFKHTKCSNKFEMTWNNFMRGQNCPYCSGKKILKGFNDIMTTDPWMIDLGMSEGDAKTHTHGSNDKVVVICPNCGKEKEITICDLYVNKSISCYCRSSSYSENYMIELLNQLNIKYTREFSPEWCIINYDSEIIKGRYDFLLNNIYINDNKVIIELDGGYHFRNVSENMSLEKRQFIDGEKDRLAKENNFYVIRINCNYNHDRFNFLKNAICNSQLNDILNLNDINWIDCGVFAIGNKIDFIKSITQDWNSGIYTYEDLSIKYKMSCRMVKYYLFQGLEFNL